MTPDATWPSAPGGEALSPPLSTQDLRAFAGAAASILPRRAPVDYYVPRWANALSNEGGDAGFNWAAALLGAHWCFWRKLYALAFIMLLAEALSGLLVVMILMQGFGWTPTPETLGPAGWLALVPVRWLLGSHANLLYLSHAIRRVSEARRQFGDSEQQHQFLAARGGTSWLALGFAVGLQLIFVAAQPGVGV